MEVTPISRTSDGASNRDAPAEPNQSQLLRTAATAARTLDNPDIADREFRVVPHAEDLRPRLRAEIKESVASALFTFEESFGSRVSSRIAALEHQLLDQSASLAALSRLATEADTHLGKLVDSIGRLCERRAPESAPPASPDPKADLAFFGITNQKLICCRVPRDAELTAPIANTPAVIRDSKTAVWPWRTGLVLEERALAEEIAQALAAAGATQVFSFRASASSFEVANAVERDQPEILFVELSKTAKPPAEWVADVLHDDNPALIVAIHAVPEPAAMISALRAGACEFLCPPLRPSLDEAMGRIGALLEARQSNLAARGKTIGFLSAKGGCGATTIAGHLTAAMQSVQPGTRILLADLDVQCPAAHQILRREPTRYVREALESVRRLTSNSWEEFVTPGGPGIDILAASPHPRTAAPEQWRVESLFRFINRHYNFVIADLGRHLNLSNWRYRQHLDEIVVVITPDVLALHQARSIVQTLTDHGFDKSRIRIVLNRNPTSPQDFWVESIEKMFEISVFGVIPNDYFSLDKLPADRFEFPAASPFGKALIKLAARIVRA